MAKEITLQELEARERTLRIAYTSLKSKGKLTDKEKVTYHDAMNVLTDEIKEAKVKLSGKV